MHVQGNIKKGDPFFLVIDSCHIILAKQNADCMRVGGKLRFPRLSAVKRDIRIAAGEIIGITICLSRGKNRMFSSKPGKGLYIFLHDPGTFIGIPAHPPDLIVLTIGIIIAFLGVKALITGAQQRIAPG